MYPTETNYYPSGGNVSFELYRFELQKVKHVIAFYIRGNINSYWYLEYRSRTNVLYLNIRTEDDPFYSGRYKLTRLIDKQQLAHILTQSPLSDTLTQLEVSIPLIIDYLEDKVDCMRHHIKSIRS